MLVAVGVLVDRFGEVGMQSDAEFSCQHGGFAEQVGGHRER
ncbi:Uncharacterised protein [Mycobacteroides abscessus subsp. abscessus]|nr:Uncharacterised protein [Mycobacteroides abscessus subsp. abscessus]